MLSVAWLRERCQCRCFPYDGEGPAAAWLLCMHTQNSSSCAAPPPTPLLLQRIEVRSADAPHSAPPRRPAAPDTSAPTFASLPLLLHPEGAGPATATEAAAGAHGRGLVLLNHRRGHGGGAMVCRRTTTCTKAAGHQGFCSGHKGFKRRESPSASSAPGRRGGFARRVRAWWWMWEVLVCFCRLRLIRRPAPALHPAPSSRPASKCLTASHPPPTQPYTLTN